MIRVHKIVSATRAEGPGLRFGLWVQGCSHKCKGCFAKDTWSTNGGYELSIDVLIKEFMAVCDKLDGVTLLGGEPFDQAKEIADFTTVAHNAGKSLITFTGYEYSYLLSCHNLYFDTILRNTDVLIDGEFVESLKDFSRPLVGSSNQNIIFLSDKIAEQDFYSYKNIIEIRSLNNGLIQINGMGDIEKIKKELEV